MDDLIVAMFWIASIWIMPMWFLMIALPSHAITERVMHSTWILFPLLLTYAVLVIPVLPELLISFTTQMPTPEMVADLLSDPRGQTLAWIHMLALDTFLGRWAWKRLKQRQAPLYQSVPILLLCMMVAPLGLLATLAMTESLPWLDDAQA